MTITITITKQQLIAAFNEWERRIESNKFETDPAFIDVPPGQRGELRAEYLMKIIEEQKQAQA